MGETAALLEELGACIGGPRAALRKAGAALRTLAAYVFPREPRRRIARLRAAGLIAREPTLWQVHQGAMHMLFRYKLAFAPLFYNQQGKPPLRHALMRFLDEPAGALDPSGLHAPMEAIVSHTIQVAHHDAAYDLELLSVFPGGVDALAGAARLLVDGRHPRQRAVDAICEDRGYHKRLLGAVEAYRSGEADRKRLQLTAPPPEGAEIYARFAHFHALSTFLEYCATLPPTPLASLRLLPGRRGA